MPTDVKSTRNSVFYTLRKRNLLYLLTGAKKNFLSHKAASKSYVQRRRSVLQSALRTAPLHIWYAGSVRAEIFSFRMLYFVKHKNIWAKV